MRSPATDPPTYDLPAPLPWAALAGPLAAAEDALARLDERLAASPLRAGWRARTDIAEARAAAALDGALVELEDLVLHDSGADVRAPTHELVRAHAGLRARRAVAAADPARALSVALGPGRVGAGRGATRREEGSADPAGPHASAPEERPAVGAQTRSAVAADDSDPLAAALAALDDVLARGERRRADPTSAATARDPLVYDPAHNEAARLAARRAAVGRTGQLPPTLAAAIALDAWTTLAPLEHDPGRGRLAAAALLVARAKARAHLPALSVGLRLLPRARRHNAHDAGTRLAVGLEAIAAAATAGLADHDRWSTARELLLRQCTNRRASSRLPALVDLVVATPIVSTGLIARALGVSERGALDLVAALGLRELTGRGRYRAWGIL